MKLPDRNALGTTPVPQPSTGLASYSTGQDFEASGRALAKAGDEMVTQGKQMGVRVDELAREAQREAEKADQMRAEQAFTTLRNKQLDLTVGEADGYERLQGSAAVTRPVLQEWSDKFVQSATGIENGLANDNQKELFRKRASVANLQYREGILRHVVKESNVYAKEVFDGTVKVEVRSATANWQSPNDVGLSVARIEAGIDAMAERQKWPPEFKEAERLKATGQVYSSVIGQAIASGDYVYAQAVYEKNKADVDPATAKVLERAVAEGTQKQVSAQYQTLFLGARNDVRSLDALQRAVEGDKVLDDTRKNALVGRIVSRSEQVRNQAARAQEQAEKRFERQINAVNAITLAGFEPTAEQLTPLINASKGTGMEGQVNQMVNLANATRQFRLAGPQQQEAMLTRMEVAARQDPTKFDVTSIAKFRTIYDNQQKAVKEDPTSFAVRQGLVNPDDPAVKPLDLNDTKTLAPQLAARFDLARAVSARYGVAPKPLTKEETDAAVATLRSGGADQKRDFLRRLASAAGNDFDGYKAMMGQIAPDDPVTAAAGIAVARGRLTTDIGMTAEPGRATNAADIILQGQAALRPARTADGKPDQGKLWPMPPDTDMRKVWQSQERDAFAGRPEVRNAFYQTAQAAYAGLSIQEGDATGVLNSRRWEAAIKLATGGIEKYNGQGTIMPWGHDLGSFRDGLNKRVDVLSGTGRLPEGVTPQRLRDLPLEPVGDGKYVFRAGDAVVLERAQDDARRGELGYLKRPDGKVSTELSITVTDKRLNDGKPTNIPLLVTGQKAVDDLLADKKPSREQEEVAIRRAAERVKAGGSLPAHATIEDAVRAAEARPEGDKTPYTGAKRVGRPLVIDFNQPLPFAPSGSGREGPAQPTEAETREAAAAARGRPVPRRVAQ